MCLPKCEATGKSSFRSRGDALNWIGRQQHHTRKGWKPPHRAYHCEHCGHWHLTKQQNHSRKYRDEFMR